VFAVYAGVALAGIAPAAFAVDAVRDGFIAATASALAVAPADVGIVAVAAAAAPSAGRRLAQTDAATQVDYQVYLTSAAAAGAISDRIVATGGGATAAALQAAGVPTTGVVLTTAPTVATLAAPGACPPGMAGDGVACAACTLSAALSASFVGGALPRAADATLAAVAAAGEGCNAAGGFLFVWSTNASSAAALAAAATGPVLPLPARTLPAGAGVAFSVRACLAAATATCANASLAFAIAPSPLVALIGGGGGVVGETPLTLSGGASYDPDDDAAALSFAWSCARADGAACASVGGDAFTPSGAAAQSLQLAGAPGGASYVISLTVSSAAGGRASSTNTTLTVLPGALPLVAIGGAAVLSGAKADPTAQLVLLANATSSVPGAVATRWSLAAQSGLAAGAPALNLSDPAVCATPVTSVSLVIRPGALAPGASYVLQLSATDAVGAVGSANASIRTSSPARGGWADVSPASGVALSTPFVLTAAGWSADADELPLSYAAEYTVDGSDAAAVSLTGGAFQAAPSFVAQLPAGNVTLRLVIRSAFGATISTRVSVSVAWPSFADAAAASAFVGDKTEAAAVALAGGDAVSALQLVGGLAALLNANATALGGAAGDVAVAAAQRASLLSIVADAVNQGSSAPASAASVESTAALVAQLVATPAQMSGAGSASALAVLGALAGAGKAVSPAAAQSVADALSAVAFAPSAGNATASSGNNYGAVLSVLGSLAASQAAALAVPGQLPATVSTPVIQMAVSLDDASGGRLFTSSLSAPGSNSSFDPLPADALAAAGGAPVSTLFLSLAFDAYGGPDSNNSGGVTRLEFKAADDGAPVAVRGLAAPVLFTMPPAVLAPGQRATCSWWDAAAGTYSADGCAALPSPYPPGHELAFSAGFVASDAASLATAWNISSGPLLDGCSVAFLDCTNATARASGRLDVGAAGALTCGNASDIVLRAYTGAACGLRNASNAASCAWDVVTQAFAGAGCVAAPATRCACVHLTDFASSPAPNIPVCSLSDLLSLKPGDIVTKLKTLFIVVCVLFGAMNIGASAGFGLDVRERAAVVARLHTPPCGFRQTEGGAWLWRFGLRALPRGCELAPPEGPAVELAALFGMPFARLRAALPDELFSTHFGAALGRRAGLSAAGMAAAAPVAARLRAAAARATRKAAPDAPALQAQPDTRRVSRRSLGPDDADDTPRVAGQHADEVAASSPPPAAADAPPTDETADEGAEMEEFIGTALVLAFLQVAQLMPVAQLAQRRAAAAAHFARATTPAGRSFAETTTALVTLLSPGVLNARSKWFLKARLWRLVMTQAPGGYWDAVDSVAFALEARSAAEVAGVKASWLDRVKERLSAATEAAEELAESHDLGDLLTGGAAQDAGAAQHLATQKSMLSRLDSARARGEDAGEEEGGEDDDPLRCSAAAVGAAMPRRLSALRNGGELEDAERVWTTLCCIALLQTLNCCWLVTDGDLYPQQERTIVDAGREWLQARADEQPALAAALADGALEAAAARAVARWHRAWTARVDALRRSPAIRDGMALSHLHRSCTEFMRALVTKHSTCSVFLSAPLDGMQRWQTWMIVVTLVIEQLLVNIWMCVASMRADMHRVFCPRLTLIPLSFIQVLCQGCQLLRRGARAAGLRAERGDVPRRHRHVRPAGGGVRHDARGAALPVGPAGLRVHRLPGRRQPARQPHRGAHRARHRAAGVSVSYHLLRGGQRQRSAGELARLRRRGARAVRPRRAPQVALHGAAWPAEPLRALVLPLRGRAQERDGGEPVAQRVGGAHGAPDALGARGGGGRGAGGCGG
jgi:hypothetical protein